MRTAITRIGVIVTIMAIAGCGARAQRPATPTDETQPLIHWLPGTQVFPESVAIDPLTGAYYVGSVKFGTIFRGKVTTDPVAIVSSGGQDGRTSATGLAYSHDRLVVAGRQTGQVFVYDTLGEQLITRLTNGRSGTDQTFLNDVAFAPDGAAYVTDSVDPVLYQVAPDASGVYRMTAFMRFEGTAIAYAQADGAAGINLNGIVSTADGKYLIVAKRNENALFRIDRTTKDVARVALAPGTLSNPDGMCLDGQTLYVAQNDPASVAVLTLGTEFRTASLTTTITDDTFVFPTSVAKYQNRLLVVSSQFNALGSPAAVSGTAPPREPFWVTELTLPEQ